MRFHLLACALLATALAVPARAQEGPLTLQEAIAAALKNNETAAAADTRTARSEALLREAYGALIPSLRLTGTYTRRDEEIVRQVGGSSATIQSLNALSAAATARAELFNAPAIPLIRGARRIVQASELDADDAKRRLARDAADAYIAVLAADELVGAAEERVAYSRRTVEEARARASAGLASKTDVTRAEVEFSSAELALTTARNIAGKARLALSFITALEAARPLTTPTFPAPISGTADALTEQAQDKRPDLKASLLTSEAARFRARAPWLQYVPSLGLEGSYRTTNEAGISGDPNSWSVSALATWTLYDGGINAARARQAGADADLAALSAKRLRRSIGVEVRNALADLETAQAALQQADTAARAAVELRDEVAQRFSYGLASGLEQADAAVSAFEAQAAFARSQLDFRRAQLDLSVAMGGWPAGYQPDSESAP